MRWRGVCWEGNILIVTCCIELQVLGSKDCAVVCPSQVKLCVHNSQTDGLSATGACRRSDQVAELNQAKGDMNDGLIMEADHRPLGPSAGRGEVGRWGPGTIDKPATSETKGEDLLQIARNNAELHGPYNWIGQLTWGGSSCWDSHNPLWSHWPWCSYDQGHWMTYQICVRLNKSLRK